MRIHHFTSFSASAVNLEGVLSGRPFGGVSLMGKKSMGHFCSIISFARQITIEG